MSATTRPSGSSMKLSSLNGRPRRRIGASGEVGTLRRDARITASCVRWVSSFADSRCSIWLRTFWMVQPMARAMSSSVRPVATKSETSRSFESRKTSSRASSPGDNPRSRSAGSLSSVDVPATTLAIHFTALSTGVLASTAPWNLQARDRARIGVEIWDATTTSEGSVFGDD